MKHMLIKPAANRERPKLVPWLVYGALGLVWLGTVSLSIRASDGLTTSHIRLSATQLRLVDLAVALPGLAIWAAILFAARSIGHYARAIAGSKEAAGFRYLARGIYALLIGLVVSSYLGGLQQLLSHHAAHPQQVKTDFVIVSNYVSVVSALITYGLVLQGGRLLLRSIGARLEIAQRLLIGVSFAVLTVAYLWLIHDNPARQTSVDPAISPTFGLPYWLIVLTVALPFVFSWFVGLLALLSIHQYGNQTAGLIYKLLFKKLLIGMTLFISLTMLLQLLTQLYNLYADSSLSFVLGIIALVYLILTYAFMLVAQGARRLNGIERLQ
jgi:hypothetical protein